MPFLNKSFSQILNDMVVHLTSTSEMTDMNTGSVARTFLESTALVIDEAYFQMVNLLNGFYINTAAGADLDRRASDFGLQRKLSLQANVLVTFSGSGTPVIPAGTMVSAPASGNIPEVIFITTSSGTIGNLIPATCQVAGAVGNVASGAITTIINNPNPILITGVTNNAPSVGGQDQEADDTFRARLQAFLESFSKGTVNSIIAAALGVTEVTVATVLENYTISGYSISPSLIDLADGGTLSASGQIGNIVVVIDNGSGSLPPAVVPITQNILLGSVDDPTTFPGYVAAGIQCFTTRPINEQVDVDLTLSVASNVIDTGDLITAVENALSLFIQQKHIGDQLFLSEIIDQTMNITGVTNVLVTSVLLNGSNANLAPSSPASKLVAGTITITVA